MDPLLYRIVLLVITISNGLPRHAASGPVRPKPVHIATQTPKAPFNWLREQKKELLGKFKKLKRGDKIEDVARLLGPPYSVNLRSHKASEDSEGTFVSYYLKKIENIGSNEKEDQYIVLVFDLDNRLESIMTNMKGLTFGMLTDPLNSPDTQFGQLEDLDESIDSKPKSR